MTGEKIVDRVYVPGQKNGIALSATSALVLLGRLRDEAHRFANLGRTKQANRRVLRSELDDVPGIGPKAKRALYKGLGSIRQIRAASDAEILAQVGITRRHLAALRAVFPEPIPDADAASDDEPNSTAAEETHR